MIINIANNLRKGVRKCKDMIELSVYKKYHNVASTFSVAKEGRATA